MIGGKIKLFFSQYSKISMWYEPSFFRIFPLLTNVYRFDPATIGSKIKLFFSQYSKISMWYEPYDRFLFIIIKLLIVMITNFQQNCFLYKGYVLLSFCCKKILS